SEGAGGEGAGLDHHRDRASRRILFRRRLSSAISGQESGRLLRAWRHRRVVSDRRRSQRLILILEHDPEKWVPVFPRDKRGTRLRGDHAQFKMIWPLKPAAAASPKNPSWRARRRRAAGCRRPWRGEKRTAVR